MTATIAHRVKVYGITVEDYERMLTEQGGVCKICRRPSRTRALHIDHDHRCCPESGQSCGKCVRGLLCNVCNTGRVRLLDSIRHGMGDLSFQRLLDYVSDR